MWKKHSSALGRSLRRRLHRLLVRMARAGLIDTRRLFWDSSGIAQWRANDLAITGERRAQTAVIPKYIVSDAPIVFDVGANIGDFTAEILANIPNARVTAFEPHPAAFAKFQARFSCAGSPVAAHNLGMSSQPGSLDLYDHPANEGSGHSSLYPAVITQLHKEEQVSASRVVLTTLDAFCAESGTETIDFLKVDTEGHELDVLRGAERLLAERRIKLIQFEFNEMNVISRVFLKDFYDLLPEFRFFRLAEDRLIDLGSYDAGSEIFRLQNILAIRSDLLETARQAEIA